MRKNSKSKKPKAAVLLSDGEAVESPDGITWQPKPNGEKGRRPIFVVSMTYDGLYKATERKQVHVSTENGRTRALEEAKEILKDMKERPDYYIQLKTEGQQRRAVNKAKVV